jgi:quinol monooxygenase YgiN
MAIRVVAGKFLLPGVADEYFAVRDEEVEQTLLEPGCVQYEIFQSRQDPLHIVNLEHWFDRAALNTHLEVVSRLPRNAAAMIDRARTPVGEGIEIYEHQLLVAMDDGSFAPIAESE